MIRQQITMDADAELVPRGNSAIRAQKPIWTTFKERKWV